ncbi:MAG: acyltransferase [Fimbriimonas ginsengisoli]|uniref:Acyltransferase n=1 Tax=Fimbriimonas ginsengisoli TaxID=1005039 RepID=A0A931LRT4_FIMGI|nr:acyltransferase [Fimbriimonas ginsengisoli]
MRYPLVDYARLGLALSVMLTHTRNELHLWPSDYAPNWAVPAFLAISGYFVLASFERSASWREFAVKRLLRVGPAFVVSLLLMCALFGSVGLWQSTQAYLTFGFRREAQANAPLWSLSVEEVAYAFMAVGVVVGFYRRRWPIWIALVLSLTLVTLYQALPSTSDGPAFRVTSVIASFFAGSLVYIYRGRIPPLAGFVSLWLGLLLTFHLRAPGCALMGAGLVAWLTAWTPSVPKIPDLSYGVYVYHFPLVLAWREASLPWALYLPVLGVLCLLSWYLIEAPALSLRAGRSGVRPHDPLVAEAG